MCQFVSFGLTVSHKIAKALIVSCSSHRDPRLRQVLQNKKQKITVVFIRDMKNYQL